MIVHMADFILFLTAIGYLVWILSAVTKQFHFSGSTSPVFGTILALFVHTEYINLPMWIVWLFTISMAWKILRVIGQAEKPIYMLTGVPRMKEEDNEQEGNFNDS